LFILCGYDNPKLFYFEGFIGSDVDRLKNAWRSLTRWLALPIS